MAVMRALIYWFVLFTALFMAVHVRCEEKEEQTNPSSGTEDTSVVFGTPHTAVLSRSRDVVLLYKETPVDTFKLRFNGLFFSISPEHDMMKAQDVQIHCKGLPTTETLSIRPCELTHNVIGKEFPSCIGTLNASVTTSSQSSTSPSLVDPHVFYELFGDMNHLHHPFPHQYLLIQKRGASDFVSAEQLLSHCHVSLQSLISEGEAADRTLTKIPFTVDTGDLSYSHASEYSSGVHPAGELSKRRYHIAESSVFGVPSPSDQAPDRGMIDDLRSKLWTENKSHKEEKEQQANAKKDEQLGEKQSKQLSLSLWTTHDRILSLVEAGLGTKQVFGGIVDPLQQNVPPAIEKAVYEGLKDLGWQALGALEAEALISPLTEAICKRVIIQVEAGVSEFCEDEIMTVVQRDIHSGTMEDLPYFINAEITRKTARLLIQELTMNITEQVAPSVSETLSHSLPYKTTQTATRMIVPPLIHTLAETITHSMLHSPRYDVICRVRCMEGKHKDSCAFCQTDDDHYMGFFAHYYAQYYGRYYTNAYGGFLVKMLATGAPKAGVKTPPAVVMPDVPSQ